MTAPRADAPGPSVPDALRTDADTLFAQHSIGQLDTFASTLGRLADDKQRAARALVGGRYEALLDVAHTVVHMNTSLTTLRGTLTTLHADIERHSAHSAERAAALPARRRPACPAQATRACALLLLDAPLLAEVALQHGALLQAAWGVCVGRAAHAHLAQHAPEVPDLPETQSAHAALLQSAAEVTACADARLADAPAGGILASSAALVVLRAATPTEALARFHQQRTAHLRTLLRAPVHDARDTVQAVAACVATTLAHTHAVFAPRGDRGSALHTTLEALGEQGATSRLYALGAPLLAPRAADAYAHLPDVVVRVAPPNDAACPTATDVDAACAAWSEQVASELATLSTVLDTAGDLDAIAACRTALRTAVHADRTRAPLDAPLDTFEAHVAALLDARAMQLVEQLLRTTVEAFADAVRTGLEAAARGPPPVFPPAPAPLDAAALLETRLVRAARHAEAYGSVAAEPLAKTCDALVARLSDAARDDAPSLVYLLRLCARLQTVVAPRLQASDATWSARLSELYAALEARWTGVVVDAACDAARKAPASPRVPSSTVVSEALYAALRTLSVAQLQLGSEAPDPLPAFSATWTPQGARDAAVLAHLSRGAPAAPEIAAEAARLRLAWVPWTLAHGVPAHTEAATPPAVRVARVAPRVPFL
ncbi:hypothetical protein MBRA1_002972 [Malassezia brasiliensis]|uniref:Conserved oligomeric Golgi complex subunit 1 n=1 Tax=Malassezia brasiliensis TaxID=1821822 RepID=A0AAF0IQN3_9BASI|nr:hypothetical protein MBRA1_002972 [Malassezia brasiliensis]